MPAVVSFGSVNVDRVAYVDPETTSSLADAHEWFPDPGETVAVPDGQVPATFDRYVSETFVGGKGGNQAVAAARAGADATFLGAVGSADEFDVADRLADRGVGVDDVATVDGPTGTATVFVTPDGENYIAYVAGANATVDPAYADRHRDRITDADCLLLQNEVPTETTDHVLELLGEVDPTERPTVVLDPAPHEGAGELLSRPAVDVVTPNEHEFDALTGDLREFEGTIVRTRGPDPVLVANHHSYEVHPPAVDAVDSTGAGDVFAGYLAAELAADEAIDRAVRVAATAAALSTESEGVQRATPDRETVLDRLGE